MDDFEFYGDQPGDYDLGGSYGDVSNLFDYDLSGLFDSFGGGLDLSSILDEYNLTPDFSKFDDYNYSQLFSPNDLQNLDVSGGVSEPVTVTASRIEDLPGFGNLDADQFITESVYDLKEKGIGDDQVRDILGREGATQDAITESLAQYNTGVPRDEAAGALDILSRSSGLEVQDLSASTFAAEKAVSLGGITKDPAAIQQVLIAEGMDPITAADVANKVAEGITSEELDKYLRDNYTTAEIEGQPFNPADKQWWSGQGATPFSGAGGAGGGGGGGSSSSSSTNTNTTKFVPQTPTGTKSLLPSLLGGLLGALTAPKVGGARGYQGTPAGLTASRQALTPAGRPGAGGKQFLSNVKYAADGGLMTIQPNQNVTFMASGGLPSIESYDNYLAGLNVGEARNYDTLIGRGASPAQAIDALSQIPEGKMLSGGGHLGGYSDGGRMLKGPGDGMSDSIPASIEGKRPARLANDEFVVPADVVSHLGNGSSDAGAKVLYDMMAKVRKARTGNPKQGKQINPSKFVPR